VATFVVPYREGGKTRLGDPHLADAMMFDVVDACKATGSADVLVVRDGGGQGAAVAAALVRLRGPVTIVNADLPCATAEELAALAKGGLVEKGVEFTWVPPLPFYLELLGGVFNGDNETAFGLGSIKYPLATGRARTFFELGDFGAIQLGMSVANGLQPDRLNNLILGWDLKYKYVPEGWQHALLTLAGEVLYQMRRVNVLGEDLDGDGVPDTPNEKRTRHRVGWYGYGEVQPVRFGPLSRFSLGFRYDWTEYPTNPGHQWAVQPYLSVMPSEFLRFRVGYKHTQGDTPGCCTNTGVGSARIKDELFFQSTFILGAHPAHPF